MQSRRNALGTGLKDILLSMDMGNLSSDALARATASTRDMSHSPGVCALEKQNSPRQLDHLTDIETIMKFCANRLNQWEINFCESIHAQIEDGRHLSEKQEAILQRLIDDYVDGNK